MVKLQTDPALHGALALAYLGDCVYEMQVRSYLISLGNHPIGRMHREAVALVSAPAQCRAAKAIFDGLSPEEQRILLRGRNTRPHGCPKGATPEEYAYATGLECLFGALHLQGKTERIADLFSQCLRVLLANPKEV